MPKISVPVLWNQDYSFLNSAIYLVDILSKVVTVVQLPNKVYPPSEKTPVLQPCLQIQEPNFGTLYLNMSLSAYQAAVRAASQSVAPLILSKAYTIASPSFTIVDPALTGATLVSISVDKTPMDPTGILSGDTMTFVTELQPTDLVLITYYIN